MPEGLTTIFGGTGFLGSAMVRVLRERGARVRLAARRPVRAESPAYAESIDTVPADVRDEASVEAAVADSDAVINAVGLYVERGADTFRSIHVEGAGTVARVAARAGVERLVLVSGIGADESSASRYVRARAEGERVTREHFSGATIVRPSVLFGPNDSLLAAIDGITRHAPVFPLFGSGGTRLQPVFVEDVAVAVARILEDPVTRGRTVELGGPRVLTYRQIIEAVLRYRGRRRLLLPVPFGLWTLQAKILGVLPSPPLTEDQVILMRDDNVVGEGVMGFDDLGIAPRDLEPLLPLCLDGGTDTRDGP